MGLADELLRELQQEAAVTRRYLALVPFDRADYKPHRNSETLGKLAIHVAETIAWWKEVIQNHDLDFKNFKHVQIHSTDKLLAYFDSLLLEAENILRETSDADFEGMWSMRNGETIYFTLPKRQVVRTFCMNHLIHHRAQLGVYLRMIDIQIPATYGPSADDNDVLLIQPLSGD